MPKAILTYVRAFEVDLEDVSIRTLLLEQLKAAGVEGDASSEEVAAAFKEILEADPDTLVPSLDDTFDASNFIISLPPEIVSDPLVLIVEHDNGESDPDHIDFQRNSALVPKPKDDKE